MEVTTDRGPFMPFFVVLESRQYDVATVVDPPFLICSEWPLTRIARPVGGKLGTAAIFLTDLAGTAGQAYPMRFANRMTKCLRADDRRVTEILVVWHLASQTSWGS